MGPVPRSLAVLATIPGREAALEGTLRSLRPQVAELRVICHDVKEPPAIVRELCNEWICEEDTRGSAAKLHWARSWPGLYLGCDDDWQYPADYVATMLKWVQRWKGKALVTIHGRVFVRNAKDYRKPKIHVWPTAPSEGGWVNFPGAAGIAFDTRLQVPDRVPEKNQEEAYLALWAQEKRVPIWLVPKSDHWVKWLLPKEYTGPTIWHDEKADGYTVRQRLITKQAARGGWRLHRAA